MEKNKKISRLLWMILTLLAFFNGYQLYGIFSSPTPIAKPSQSKEAVDTSSAQIQINILNGCGVAGIGNTMTNFCRNLGYDVVEAGNYKSFDVEHSVVVDRNGKIKIAKQLARQLGISEKNVITQFSSDQLVAASIIIGKDYKTLNPWIK